MKMPVGFVNMCRWWLLRLPQTAEGLWNWLLNAEQETVFNLLAYCTACTVNAVRGPHEPEQSARMIHTDQLARALNLDMAQWWQPTTASYLGRVPKIRVLEAVTEAVSAQTADTIAGMKKAAMAQAAEERLAGTGWLPPILRTPKPKPASLADAAD
jgi:ParB family transcriptional regulator, chromosome partitioning protein